MDTILTRSPLRAAQFILAGEVVAFPTETVYGLGADLFSEDAIRQVFLAKGRPSNNPLIAHIADLSQLGLLAQKLPPAAEQLIAAFFPGPLTVVVAKTESVPLLASAGLDTVGIRMPRHPLAQRFLRACGRPLVAPSANLSGRPSPTTWQAVRADLAGRISCILKGNQTEVGLESTVVDCTSRDPVVLRSGAVTLEQLRAVVPATRLLRPGSAAGAKSPGLRYRHYSPQARVVLIARPSEATASARAAYIGLDAPSQAAAFKLLSVCPSVEDYAHALFAFFRRCDEAGVEVIYCQSVTEAGLGLALMDRLRRASQG